jgi:tryptophan synthase alpha chain
VSRIPGRFAQVKREGRAAFIAFISAGDPDVDTSLALLRQLPAAGADIVELGMPFTDPMADGPAVQASSLRALKAGASMIRTFELLRRFREGDRDTPIVLMGYFNPIHAYGVARFAADAAAAGADGLIVVDLPPEEDAVLRGPARQHGLDLIRLVTPTTNDARLGQVLNGASGFLYYVSITGVTGTKSFETDRVRASLARIRKVTDLPIAVGFGVKTPEQAAAIAAIADGVVVGSALVSRIADIPKGQAAQKVLELAGILAAACRNARVNA